MKFTELVRLLENIGFRFVKEKGSVRYYGKDDGQISSVWIFMGPRKVPTGTCHAIIKAAGLSGRRS